MAAWHPGFFGTLGGEVCDATGVAPHHDLRRAPRGDHRDGLRRPGHVRQHHLKHGATKLRRLGGGKVLAGFAGSVADALALFTRFEAKFEEFSGNLERAAVELAREWRTDRALRHLEAMMVVADRDHLLLLSGSGEVIAPDDGVLGIGSGGAGGAGCGARAGRALDPPAARGRARGARIASAIDLYTNDHITVEVAP